MDKKLVYSLIIGCTLSGCLKHEASYKEKSINIQLSDEPYFIKADSIFSNVTYIPLETTDESIFYDINKLNYHNDNFYVLDSKQAAILVFDKTGKYVKKLMRKGNGPSEYLTIEDFFLKDDLLYILSSSMNKILVYNDNFDFVKSYSLGTFATNMQYINNSIFVYTNFASEDYKNIYEIDINTGKIIKKYVDFFKKQRGVRYSTSGFAKENDSLFITFPYDYSIYKIETSGYSRFYTIDFGKKYMYSPEWLKLSDEERTEKISTKYRDFWELPINSINNLSLSEKYLTFTFVHRMSEHKFVLNRKTGKFFASYISSSTQYPFMDGKFSGMIDDKFIICAQSDIILETVDNLKKNKFKLNSNTSFVDRIKPADNPVICIYTLNY